MNFTQSLKKNYEFRRVYAKGRSAASAHVVLYCMRNRLGVNRLGVTVGSKVGKAHIRNKVRRRLKEIYRLNELSFRRGWDLVAVSRAKAGSAGFDSIKKDFLFVSKKLGLLKNAENEKNTN